MATKTDPLESQHGEEEERPLFGDQSELIDPEQAEELQSHYDTPDAIPLAKGPGPETPRELLARENSGGVGSTGKASKKESSIADKLGKGFTPVDAALPPQAKLIKSLAKAFATKKGRAGLGIGGVIGMVVFLASVTQGPLQLIHLSQLLLKPEFGNEKNSSIHFTQMMRYAKTGDFGETRVGYLRSKLKDKYLEQMKDAGFDIKESTTFGRPSTLTIDSSHPDRAKFKNMTKKEVFAEVTGEPAEYVDEVDIRRSGAVWEIDVDLTKTKGLTYMEKTMRYASNNSNLGRYWDGKLANNLRYRSVLLPYFGLPGLLSPVSKKATARLEAAFTKKEAIEAEKERSSPRIEKMKELSASARSNLRDKLSPKRQAVLGLTLGGIAGYCLVHDSAEEAAEYNYQAIVKPAAAEMADKTALGSQVQSGFTARGGVASTFLGPVKASAQTTEDSSGGLDPLSAKAIGTIQRTMEDEDGKNVFAAKGIDALAKNGKGAKGEDLPLEYQQAFSGDTTADNIRDGTDINTFGVDVTALACGTPGQVVGGLATIGLLLAGPPSGGAAWAAFLGKTTAGVAAGVGAGILLTKILDSDLNIEAPVAGALGGNLLAYGSRASANMNAMSSGGVELSDSESIALMQEQDKQEGEEFKSKPFFARMFDLYDYRSMASVSIRSYSPNISRNVSGFGTTLISAPSNLASSLLPKAYAQEETYLWGRQRLFGLPKEVTEDPRLQDPYERDQKMSELLEGPDKQEYIDRAKKCFGAEISKGQNGWDAKTVQEVNPKSTEYTEADCGNIDNLNWRRTMLFVHNSKDLTALACYEGIDDAACDDLGYGAPSATGVSGDEFKIEKIDNPLNTPGDSIEPKGITLHWWAGRSNGQGINALVDALRSNPTCGDGGCSTQIGITADGKVYQLTNKLTDLTYHAAGANSTTFGIEIEGLPQDFGREGIEKYPEKFEAVVATVKYLMEKYDIELDESNRAKCNDAFGIHSHKYYQPCNPGKTDIDDYYFKEVIKRVKE